MPKCYSTKKMKKDFVPESNSGKYKLDVIMNHPMSEVVEYFIEKQKLLGKDVRGFDEKHWFNKYGNKANFWHLVEINPKPSYWIGIIDKMFCDKWVRENRFYLIKHIIEHGFKYENKEKEKKKLNPTHALSLEKSKFETETYKRNSLSVVGDFNYDNKYNSYFRIAVIDKIPIVLPTLEILIKVGLYNDMRFHIVMSGGLKINKDSFTNFINNEIKGTENVNSL